MTDNDKQLEIFVEDETKDIKAKVEEPIVEIVDDPSELPVEKKTEEEDDNSVEKQLKKLQKKLDSERQARKEAEERAQRAASELNHAYARAEDSDMHVVATAIDTVSRETEILTEKLAEAMSVGDYQLSAKLQRAISNNEAKLLQLENGRAAMANKPRQAAPAFNDPVEQFASQVSPRSAEWIRKNPQCVTDPRLQQKMIAAHNLAVADGYVPDSDDYFGFIEDTLKINRRTERQERSERREMHEEEDSPLSSASKAVSRQAPPPAAPNRDGGGRSNLVTLTKVEAEAAREMGMTPEEYARNKLLLKKEGRIH